MSVVAGEAGERPIGGAAPAAPNRRRRKRWPIWSEPRAYERTPCNICGFAGAHSTVCPFGPEPTRSKERR